MPILSTTVDVAAPSFVDNRAAMLDRLSELEKALDAARAGGGEKYVTRHHARGRMLPRERIELLIDRDTPFLELCAVAAFATDFPIGASIVGGIGVVVTDQNAHASGPSKKRPRALAVHRTRAFLPFAACSTTASPRRAPTRSRRRDRTPLGKPPRGPGNSVGLRPFAARRPAQTSSVLNRPSSVSMSFTSVSEFRTASTALEICTNLVGGLSYPESGPPLQGARFTMRVVDFWRAST